MNKITPEEAKSLVDKLGPSDRIGYGTQQGCFTQTPVFPENRRDICAVVRSVAPRASFGYDTLYLLWKNDNILKDRRIHSTNQSHRIYINAIQETDEQIVIHYQIDEVDPEFHSRKLKEKEERIINKKDYGLRNEL